MIIRTLKNAYAWMNKMYREGLMDMEVTTQKNERLTEKMNSGVIGIYPGDAWAPGLNNAWYAMQTAEDNIAAANLEPVKIPTAEGVTENGKVNYVNPYNNAMVFISKDCENLDAVTDLPGLVQSARTPLRSKRSMKALWACTGTGWMSPMASGISCLSTRRCVTVAIRRWSTPALRRCII